MLNSQELKSGEDQHETFKHNGIEYVQYDFRDKYGNLFSTIANTLDKCKEKRNTWTIKKHLEFEKEIRQSRGFFSLSS